MKVTNEMIAEAANVAAAAQKKCLEATTIFNSALSTKMQRFEFRHVDGVRSLLQFTNADVDLRIARIAKADALATESVAVRELVKLQLMKSAQEGDPLAQRALEQMVEVEKQRATKKHQAE